MALSKHRTAGQSHERASAPLHLPADRTEVPGHRLADRGLGEQLSYELVTNELLLDGQARLNLATFVTTWMPSTAGRLMSETADKNIIDKDEYPQTAAIEARCVNIIADLWHADAAEQATGCSTTGSSEAAMLC
ncbi:MAG: pyridoxal-dependent decarboxylase, partial [Solirubrobacteraceae bacterium]